MSSPRDLPLPLVLGALLLATGLGLIASMLLAPLPRGLAIAVLSLIKAALLVIGFMRLQQESRALAGALIGYAALLCALAGLRIALAA
ncbi:hypothetical protein DK26_17665 [Bosea sp. WAO]|uniref:hypothetical protein n=1 Tax=Bosea sp. WAO TaxID=406341 RepID=UPI0007470DE9|nr:hypothetical protein [Bosea sp. WAO]KUL94708.1 hypothetical protein DK26_17665 [Bosea sp. WAO]